MTYTDSEIIAAAAQASVPPALLMGIVRQSGVTNTLGLPEATMTSYGIQPQELEKNPLLGLSLAARVLAQQFTRTGNWQAAIAGTLSGDPTTAQSATSSYSGQVQAVLGWAATNPTFGMQNFQPNSAQSFADMAAGLSGEFQEMGTLGGVMDPSKVTAFNGAIQGVFQTLSGPGNVPFRPAPSVAQAMTDVMTQAGIPVTKANLAFLETMARGEGMNPGDFNWLATTSQAGQSVGTVPNTPGVQVYANYQQGVLATAQTLLNGNYNRMVQLMRGGSDLHQLASDPAVQKELETWQGGSHEDVKNLLNLANIPATPVAPAGQGQTQDHKDAHTDPDEVGKFASKLQAHNIDPSKFAEDFAWVAAQRRRLLGEKMTTVEDFAPVAGLPKDQILQNLLAQPHSKFPGLTVAQMEKARAQAELLSVSHLRQFPADSEVARLATGGVNWREMSEYYQHQEQQKAAQKQAPQQPGLPQQAGQGNNAQQQPGQQPQQRQQTTR